MASDEINTNIIKVWHRPFIIRMALKRLLLRGILPITENEDINTEVLLLYIS